MAAFVKDKDAEKPKKPMTDYQLFCHWLKSDESVGVQDPDTGEAIPLKDLHFTKQQKWFSKCWKGVLAFPPCGFMIAGLKFKTLSEMKAYFHSKYNTLQEQWHKEVAAWEKQKVNPSSQNSAPAKPKATKTKAPANSGDASSKKRKVDGSSSSTPSSVSATEGSIAGSSSSGGGSSSKHAADKKSPREGEDKSGATLADKVGRIKRALQLDEKLPMPAAIKKANTQMGLQDKGKTLPDQADALLAVLGV